MTPRTDVCKTCEDHRSAIQTAVTEDDRKRSLSDFSLHLEEAQKERMAYLDAIEKSTLAVHPKRYTHHVRFCSAGIFTISHTSGWSVVL